MGKTVLMVAAVKLTLLTLQFVFVLLELLVTPVNPVSTYLFNEIVLKKVLGPSDTKNYNKKPKNFLDVYYHTEKILYECVIKFKLKVTLNKLKVTLVLLVLFSFILLFPPLGCSSN